jgi:peroxiredoxin
VQRRYEDFRRLGVEVLVVTQARPEMLAVFLGEQPLPFPAIADPERAAYRPFGLERTSWAAIVHPGVILRYLRLVLGGWLPRQTRGDEDVLQLGGDFLLDEEGRLVYAYRSRTPTDRPSVEELLEAVPDRVPFTPPPESAPASSP